MAVVVCRSRSADDTRAIGGALASVLEPGDVVVLDGDLGAGKTALVQGAARALGVTEQVTSPSFVLVRTYVGAVPIVHIDVYRLGALQELFDLGFEQIFDPRAVTFIEWGDAVVDELPPGRIHIQIEHIPIEHIPIEHSPIEHSQIEGAGDERVVRVEAGERTLPLDEWVAG